MATERLKDETLTVLDTEGGVQPLSALWRERPVVLVFLRHFG